VFVPGFKFLLLRAMAIGRRRPDLKDSTLAQYHGDLERRLDRLLARPPEALAACSTPCAGIVTTCSVSSPAATCPTPTTPVSVRCGRP